MMDFTNGFTNLNTLLFSLNNIEVNGWIIIEDIHIPDSGFQFIIF